MSTEIHQPGQPDQYQFDFAGHQNLTEGEVQDMDHEPISKGTVESAIEDFEAFLSDGVEVPVVRHKLRVHMGAYEANKDIVFCYYDEQQPPTGKLILFRLSDDGEALCQRYLREIRPAKTKDTAPVATGDNPRSQVRIQVTDTGDIIYGLNPPEVYNRDTGMFE